MPEGRAETARTCVVTGSRGFVGREVVTHLRRGGWRVSEWSRNAPEGGRSYRLEGGLAPAALEGVDALVHCAWDFSLHDPDRIRRVNVEGSERLLRAARDAGVEGILFISSISAYPGCRSHYGQAKLAVEAVAAEVGGQVVRPGLVWSAQPGGVFGGLVRLVGRSPVLPLAGMGGQVQYLVHAADLAGAVERFLAPDGPALSGPITLAHPEGLSLRELIRRIGRALGRNPVLVPVPWQLGWSALRLAEVAGLAPPFRSDSLTGLVHPDPEPSLEDAARLGLTVRPPRFGEGALAGR